MLVLILLQYFSIYCPTEKSAKQVELLDQKVGYLLNLKQRIMQGIQDSVDHKGASLITLGDMHRTLCRLGVPLSPAQFCSLSKSSRACTVKYAQLLEEIFSSGNMSGASGSSRDAISTDTVKAYAADIKTTIT